MARTAGLNIHRGSGSVFPAQSTTAAAVPALGHDVRRCRASGIQPKSIGSQRAQALMGHCARCQGEPRRVHRRSPGPRYCRIARRRRSPPGSSPQAGETRATAVVVMAAPVGEQPTLGQFSTQPAVGPLGPLTSGVGAAGAAAPATRATCTSPPQGRANCRSPSKLARSTVFWQLTHPTSRERAPSRLLRLARCLLTAYWVSIQIPHRTAVGYAMGDGHDRRSVFRHAAAAPLIQRPGFLRRRFMLTGPRAAAMPIRFFHAFCGQAYRGWHGVEMRWGERARAGTPTHLGHPWAPQLDSTLARSAAAFARLAGLRSSRSAVGPSSRPAQEARLRGSWILCSYTAPCHR
jgi:hypothetical protein